MKLTMADFLVAVEEHRSDAYEMLVEDGHLPKVVQTKAVKASRRGYIDFGVHPTRGWLTDKGKAFLEQNRVSS